VCGKNWTNSSIPEYAAEIPSSQDLLAEIMPSSQTFNRTNVKEDFSQCLAEMKRILAHTVTVAQG